MQGRFKSLNNRGCVFCFKAFRVAPQDEGYIENVWNYFRVSVLRLAFLQSIRCFGHDLGE